MTVIVCRDNDLPDYTDYKYLYVAINAHDTNGIPYDIQ